VTRVGRPYLPVQDPATIDLLVRDVFGAHTPLVGSYSRGFNHPGPLLFYVLTPLSKLTGEAPWSILVGAALVQGAGLVGVAWIARRRGGTPLALLMLAAVGLSYFGLDQLGQFTHAWNPYAALPFLPLFLLLAWSTVLGDRWCALGVVATGSFVVQCHVGYAPLVLAVAIWVVVMVAVDRPSTPRAPQWSMVALWSGALAVALWLAPVLEQLLDEPGNLRALWRYFLAGGTTLGVRDAIGIFGTEFRWWPPWLGGHEVYGYGSGDAIPASPWWALVPVALLGAGWIAARRSGRRSDRRLVELAAVVAVVAVVAMARVTVAPVPFVFYWRVTVATFVVAASAWAIAHALPAGWRPWSRRFGVAAALVAIVVAFGAQTIDVIDHRHRLEGIEAAAHEALDRVAADGLPTRPVLVRSLGGNLGGFDQGVVDALDREGVAVRVDPRFGFHFGDQRTSAVDAVDSVWYVAEEGRFASLLPELPGARVVASVSPLTPAEERELRQLQRDAAAAFRAAGRDDLVDQLDSIFFGVLASPEDLRNIPGLSVEQVERITELNRKVVASGSCRCSIVAFPTSQDPDLPNAFS
jgi:hypothetical protein